MRLFLFLGAAFCLATAAAAQESRRGDGPRAAIRPITNLLQNLRDELLLKSRLEQAPQPAASAAEHKVVLQLSEDLFTSLIHREFDEHTPVQDVILGTAVAGQARTIAQPHVDLVPHASEAAFQVVMEGTTVSRTTGRNGPAVLQSHSTTHFRAVKQVLFSPERGFYSLPAEVDARTQVATDKIGSVRGGLIGRIVRRRAWREVQEKRPQTQAIVQEKARRRLAAVVDTQVNEGLARLNRRNDVRQLVTAILPGAARPRYACCSTERYVQIVASKDSAAIRPIVLPPAEYLTSPVQLWVHRSVVRPNLPDVLSRVAADRLQMSGLVSFSRVAPAAFIGSEVLKSATTNWRSSALDVERIEDWMVVEFGDQPQTSRIVHR